MSSMWESSVCSREGFGSRKRENQQILSTSWDHYIAIWMLRGSFSVVSSGIKAAFAAPVVAKDLSQQPLPTETEKSSVKVCVYSHWSFDRQLKLRDISIIYFQLLKNLFVIFHLRISGYSAAFRMQTWYLNLFLLITFEIKFSHSWLNLN